MVKVIGWLAIVGLVLVGLYHVVPAAVSSFFWLLGWIPAFVWNEGPHAWLQLPRITEHQAVATLCILVALKGFLTINVVTTDEGDKARSSTIRERAASHQITLCLEFQR